MVNLKKAGENSFAATIAKKKETMNEFISRTHKISTKDSRRLLRTEYKGRNVNPMITMEEVGVANYEYLSVYPRLKGGGKRDPNQTIRSKKTNENDGKEEKPDEKTSEDEEKDEENDEKDDEQEENHNQSLKKEKINETQANPAKS